MKTQRWFLPEMPDVIGMLKRQFEVTVQAAEALAQWAHGDEAKAELIRELEHRADGQKHEFETTLLTAFTTPLEPEDLYTLSRGIDWVLGHMKDLVRESEVMACPPDEPLAQMCEALSDAVHLLAEAIEHLDAKDSTATDRATEALRAVRRIETIYRDAMAALLVVSDLHEVTARRELYRRLSRTGDVVIDVAERIWYAVVKEG